MNIFSNKNSVTIEGNIANIDVKQGQHGYFGSITVAVNNSYKDQNDNWVEQTAFVDVNVGGKFLSKLKAAPNKGDRIELEGKLVTEKWQDKTTGANRSALKVQALKLVRHVEKSAIDCLKQAGFIQVNQNQQAAPQQPVQQANGFNQQAAPQQQSGFNQPAQQPNGFAQGGGFNQPQALANQRPF